MMANENEVSVAITRERANLEWINRSLPTLRKKFGDRFIAVMDRKVVDHDPDFEKLLARVPKDGKSGKRHD
jgi:hypothetical protein